MNFQDLVQKTAIFSLNIRFHTGRCWELHLVADSRLAESGMQQDAYFVLKDAGKVDEDAKHFTSGQLTVMLDLRGSLQCGDRNSVQCGLIGLGFCAPFPNSRRQPCTNSLMSGAGKTRLVKPKTKKGERVLKDREPQLVNSSFRNPFCDPDHKVSGLP
jgi:hypothetical protein